MDKNIQEQSDLVLHCLHVILSDKLMHRILGYLLYWAHLFKTNDVVLIIEYAIYANILAEKCEYLLHFA